MINKNELKILVKIENLILNKDTITKKDIEEYQKVVDKMKLAVERRTKASIKYNNKNYEYYMAMKNFYANRKKGNEEKAKYWLEKALKIKSEKR